MLPPPENAWADDEPFVSSAGLLTDASMRDLLANGFPARLHYRLERWVGGRWFDDLKAASEWDVILKYDVLGKKYQVVRVVNKKAESLGEFPTLEEASTAVEAPVPDDDPAAEERAAWLLQSAAGCRDAVAERSRRGGAVAARGAQAGGQREEESGDRCRPGGADAGGEAARGREEALRGEDRDVQAVIVGFNRTLPVAQIALTGA